MDWNKIYLNQIEKQGGNKVYMEYKINHKKKLLQILRNYSGNGKIIEAGCGTGIITSQLASEGFDVVGIDINKDILKLAKRLEKDYFGKNKARFIEKSIFDLSFKENEFDLCFSCGVLEHFPNEMIIDSISQQLKISKTVIIVIPTKWFDNEEALHGDDRFLNISYWRKLIKESGGKVIKEYSYPFKQNLMQKIKNIKKIFRPKAYRVYVVQK